MKLKAATLIAMCWFMSACSVLDDMKSMKKNTEEMNQTTKEMNENTKAMNKRMDNMDSNMGKMNGRMENMDKNTSEMSERTASMDKNMNIVGQRMENMDKNTSTMSKTTANMDKNMNTVSQRMDNMDKNTAAMAQRTESMDNNMTAVSKRMENMDNNTTQMNQGMNDMIGLTKDMSKQMEEMKGYTRDTIGKMTEMLDAVRSTQTETVEMKKMMHDLYELNDKLSMDMHQGQSIDQRRKLLAEIASLPGFKSKLLTAAIYYSAFEFQMQRKVGDNYELHKERMLSDAVEHVINDAHRFNKESYNNTAVVVPNIEIPLLFSNNDNTSLLAFTAAMHWKNPQVHVIEKENNEPATSIYDLIEKGLLAKASIASGEKKLNDYPAYVGSVLRFEKDAVYLMHLRYNALLTLLIAQTGNVDETLLSTIPKAAVGWSLDLGRLNSAQLADNMTVLYHANRTRALLEKIGQKPAVNGLLARLITNAKVETSLASVDTSGETAQGNCQDVSIDEMTDIFTPARICVSQAKLSQKLAEGMQQMQKSLH